jgi:WXG100 family type VII secretion target
MTNNVIQVQYETLDHISQRFAQAAENTEHMHTRVAHTSNELLTQGWEGRGASAFANEMDDVLPALDRLQHALREASQVTLEIARIMREAEEEAAGLFDADGFQADTPHVTDSFLGDIGDGIRDKFRLFFPYTVAEAADYLDDTPAGRQLIEKATENGLAFRLPNGTIIGCQEGDARIIDVKTGDLDWAYGQYVNANTEITIDNDILSRVRSKEELAGTLAHEMQHALDYHTGKIGKEEGLEAFYQDRIDSEIRAWERGEAVTENREYQDDGHMTGEERQKILNKGYESNYEDELSKRFPNKEFDLKLDSNGNVQIDITEPQENDGEWWEFWNWF